MNVREALSQVPVVGVIRRCPADFAEAAGRAAAEAGFRVLEVTMDSPEAARQIATLAAGLPDVCIGAGTVREPALVDAAVEAGAKFCVAPDFRPDVVERAKALGVDMIPGTMTPTEITAAWRAGAAMVKVFPSVVLGAGYFRALRGPLPDVPLIATGGVTASLGRELLSAGADAVGATADVFDPDALVRRDAEDVARRAKAYVDEITRGR